MMNRSELVNAVNLVMKDMNPSALGGKLRLGECVEYFAGDIIASVDLVTGVDCVVDGEPLLKILTKLKTDEVALTTTDSALVISTDKTKTELLRDVTFEFPEEPVEPEWKPFELDMDSLSLASKIVQKGGAREAFGYVCISEGKMNATNGHMLLCCDIDDKDMVLMLNQDVVKKVVRTIPDEYAETESMYLFKNDNMKFRCTKGGVKVDGYPNVNRIIRESADMEKEPLDFPEDMSDAIARLRVFDDSNTGNLFVDIKKKSIVFTMTDLHGTHKERVKTAIDKELSFLVNINYMAKFSDRLTKVFLCKGQLLRIEDGRFVGIIMLKRSK